MTALPSKAAEPFRPGFQILVADDNDVMRLAIRILLGRLGHTVEVASNGREAVEAATRRAFDFIFLDFQMPEMGGIEAACRLRRLPPGASSPRIVGLSADASYASAAATAAMDDFLVKPVRLVDLSRVLEHR